MLQNWLQIWVSKYMKIKLKTIYSLRVRFVVKINNKQYLI